MRILLVFMISSEVNRMLSLIILAVFLVYCSRYSLAMALAHAFAG